MCPATMSTGITAPRKNIQSDHAPLFIGDALHVLNQQVHEALVREDREPISLLVKKQLANGANGLSVNLGPGRETGRKSPWMVETIRAVTDVPLFFSANIIEHIQVLEEQGPSLVINAVTANPDDLERGLAAAMEYSTSLVVLLVRSGIVTGSITDKIQIASEVLEQAVAKGMAPDRLYLDPVLSCRPDPTAWHVSRGVPDISSVIETVGLIRQLASRVKTIVALGNGSEGMEKEKRSGLHGRMLSLLGGAGLDAVLLNCLDGAVMHVADTVANGRDPNCQCANRTTGDICAAA